MMRITARLDLITSQTRIMPYLMKRGILNAVIHMFGHKPVQPTADYQTKQENLQCHLAAEYKPQYKQNQVHSIIPPQKLQKSKPLLLAPIGSKILADSVLVL